MLKVLPSKEFDEKYNIIESATPRHTALSGRYKRSFAYYTLRERLPVILTQVIDQINRDKDELAKLYNDEETREEIKNVAGLISKLKYELQTDKKFQSFTGDEPDKKEWNTFIAELPSDYCSFFQSCWLYSECYMYRKLSSFFENTKTLKSYDYFAKQKQNSLPSEGILVVCRIMRNLEKDFKTFEFLIKLTLLGNKSDLSLVLPKEFKPGQNVFQQLNSFNKKILVNNTSAIWECLSSADVSKPIIVEFINDNSNFELFTDLILADYIIDKQLASKVRFSVKAVPWYVSDVISTDVTWILDSLSSHKSSYVRDYAAKLKQYFKEGKFVLSPVHYFWVSAYEYYKMREVAPDLYAYLSEAHLVIFKGDLNYRKLLGDISWDPTEEFITCLRGFQPTNLCSLRTLKADIVCGLPQGIAETLQRTDSNWLINGEYGVIHFLEGNSCKCYKNAANNLVTKTNENNDCK